MTKYYLEVIRERVSICLDTDVQYHHHFKVGDIIPMNTTPAEEAIIRVEGTPKYRGFVGTATGSRAIKVTGAVLDPEEIK